MKGFHVVGITPYIENSAKVWTYKESRFIPLSEIDERDLAHAEPIESTFTLKEVACIAAGKYVEKTEKWVPKVGEYIVFLKPFDCVPKGQLRRITSIREDPNGEYWVKYLDGGFRIGGNGYFSDKDFRKALPHEIPKQQHEHVSDAARYMCKTIIKPSNNLIHKEADTDEPVLISRVKKSNKIIVL